MRRMLVGLLLLLTAPFALATPATQPAEAAKRVRGILVGVDGNTLTLRPGMRPTTQPSGDAPPPVAVSVDERTQLRVEGVPATVADLTPGMTVDCVPLPGRGDRPPVMIVSATSPGIDGTIANVDGDTIVLHVTSGGARGTEVRVETDEGTRVRFLGVGRDVAPRTGELPELAVGTRVRVIPATGTARIVYARPQPAEPTSQPSR